MQRLKQYRRKRDFRRTPEPEGAAAGDATAGARLFVVHKHAARRPHFDLRLEQNGVLRSWAVPKGLGLEAGDKRLAVQVEDHPLEYAHFEGVIPKDAYGAGTVMLWDRGHWIPKSADDSQDRLDFVLEGQKLRGAWTLVRMTGRPGGNGKNWLLIKRQDASPRTGSKPRGKSVATGRTMQQITEDYDRIWHTGGGKSAEDLALPDPATLNGARKGPLLKDLRPQLASLVSEAPNEAGWIHEIKFDGYRILARLQAGKARLITRNGKDWTDRFPDLVSVLERLPVDRLLLDGEVVALGPAGVSSFRRLQEALSTGRTAELVYQVFDVLHLNDHELTGVGLLTRKQALARLCTAVGLTGGSSVRYTDHLEAQGAAMFEQACRLGVEGIISKRGNSTYRSGRSRQWLKVKCARHDEFVVGGYTDPGGSRTGFGSLLLGAHDGGGDLIYTGRVGTGFTQRQLEALHTMLSEHEVSASPFRNPVPDIRGVHWVQPARVVEVEYTEKTRDGRLRHPSFRGLREDRDPGEIRLVRDQDRVPGTAAYGRTLRRPAARTRMDADEIKVAGIRLTHPQRILYPEQGVTKLDLALYYEKIQDWILPQLSNRPLSLLRCPEGRRKQCFFQKHPHTAIAASVPLVEIEEKAGTAEYLYVQSAADLVALVQAGVLEFHPWGSRIETVEQPDTLVFDLDPAPDIPWSTIQRVATELRDRLDALGLASFVRTTGGKGLHLVVPITPRHDWAEVKAFARAVAQLHARDDRQRLTTNMAKAKRRGRIFIDYLRNGRGSTAIASYSSRARAGAPVAVPVRWDELHAGLRSDRYNLQNLRRRLAALRADPWDGFADARRPLDQNMRRAVGLERGDDAKR